MMTALVFAMSVVFAPPPPDTRFETAVNNGLRYLQGIGVAKDHPRALAWFYVARDIDPSVNAYIRMVEPYLSDEQFTRARRIADACAAVRIDHCDLLPEKTGQDQ